MGAFNLIREVAQLGRALGLGPRGRRFESCLPDFENYLKKIKKVVDNKITTWYDIKVVTATNFRPLKTEQSKTNQMCRAFLLCRNKPYLVNNIR